MKKNICLSVILWQRLNYQHKWIRTFFTCVTPAKGKKTNDKKTQTISIWLIYIFPEVQYFCQCCSSCSSCSPYSNCCCSFSNIYLSFYSSLSHFLSCSSCYFWPSYSTFSCSWYTMLLMLLLLLLLIPLDPTSAPAAAVPSPRALENNFLCFSSAPLPSSSPSLLSSQSTQSAQSEDWVLSSRVHYCTVEHMQLTHRTKNKTECPTSVQPCNLWNNWWYEEKLNFSVGKCFKCHQI